MEMEMMIKINQTHHSQDNQHNHNPTHWPGVVHHKVTQALKEGAVNRCSSNQLKEYKGWPLSLKMLAFISLIVLVLKNMLNLKTQIDNLGSKWKIRSVIWIKLPMIRHVVCLVCLMVMVG